MTRREIWEIAVDTVGLDPARKLQAAIGGFPYPTAAEIDRDQHRERFAAWAATPVGAKWLAAWPKERRLHHTKRRHASARHIARLLGMDQRSLLRLVDEQLRSPAADCGGVDRSAHPFHRSNDRSLVGVQR